MRIIIIRSMVKPAVRVLLAVYPAFRGSSLVIKDETSYLTELIKLQTDEIRI